MKHFLPVLAFIALSACTELSDEDQATLDAAHQASLEAKQQSAAAANEAQAARADANSAAAAANNAAVAANAASDKADKIFRASQDK